jgi:hypothetical protein
LYRYDGPITAVGFRAADAVTLVLAIPLLVSSILPYRRGRLQGRLGLSGALAYFLYNYGSMAVGAAYNSLFLVYVALFSTSLFGLVLCLASFDVQALPAHFTRDLPRRDIGMFLVVSGGDTCPRVAGVESCSRPAPGHSAEGSRQLDVLHHRCDG